MTKYICIRNMDFSPKEYNVGDIVEINKLDEPITERYEFEDVVLSAELHYKIQDTGFRLHANTLKYFFRKIQPKETVPKHILKTLLFVTLYELSKAITYEVIVKKQANDMVEQPGYDEIDAWKKY